MVQGQEEAPTIAGEGSAGGLWLTCQVLQAPGPGIEVEDPSQIFETCAAQDAEARGPELPRTVQSLQACLLPTVEQGTRRLIGRRTERRFVA